MCSFQCVGETRLSLLQILFFSVIGVERPLPDHPWEKEEPVVWGTSEAIKCHLSDMLQQLTRVNASKPSERRLVRQEEAEDPACIPIFWVSQWVDQSMKYGLGRCLQNVRWAGDGAAIVAFE
ncbi:serine/threonine-protein kinase PLK1-like [Peromyscus maniculatus bairdii]|uniref:serine/threonine-protein kinase PLK1-like n=1 Tax=Peromyscus maniculatus bairdii TaxID=230844 RepID=UPI003FD199FC